MEKSNIIIVELFIIQDAIKKYVFMTELISKHLIVAQV